MVGIFVVALGGLLFEPVIFGHYRGGVVFFCVCGGFVFEDFQSVSGSGWRQAGGCIFCPRICEYLARMGWSFS